MQVLWGVGGMVVLLAIAFGLSTNRRAINPRTVFGALAIQFLLGVIVLYWSAGKRALQAASNAVQVVIDSSNEGIEFSSGPFSRRKSWSSPSRSCRLSSFSPPSPRCSTTSTSCSGSSR